MIFKIFAVKASQYKNFMLAENFSGKKGKQWKDRKNKAIISRKDGDGRTCDLKSSRPMTETVSVAFCYYILVTFPSI